jgi:hypothetical protein
MMHFSEFANSTPTNSLVSPKKTFQKGKGEHCDFGTANRLALFQEESANISTG